MLTNLTYNDVYQRLMDLASTSILNQAPLDNTAYKAKAKQPKECSWCSKQGYYSKGHTWQTCFKLKAYKEKDKKKDEKGNSATSSEVTAFFADLNTTNHHYWVFDIRASVYLTSD